MFASWFPSCFSHWSLFFRCERKRNSFLSSQRLVVHSQPRHARIKVPSLSPRSSSTGTILAGRCVIFGEAHDGIFADIRGDGRGYRSVEKTLRRRCEHHTSGIDMLEEDIANPGFARAQANFVPLAMWRSPRLPPRQPTENTCGCMGPQLRLSIVERTTGPPGQEPTNIKAMPADEGHALKLQESSANLDLLINSFFFACVLKTTLPSTSTRPR